MQKIRRFLSASILVALLSLSTAMAQEGDAVPKKSGFNFKVGGFVLMSISEDFSGAINNYDFFPSLIDVPNSTASSELFHMDFSTSRINFDASTHSEKLGDVEMHIDMDFRGGSQGSYTLRMRNGYVKNKNFLIGKTFTNFMDCSAMLAQIDFQGSNGYCFNYSPQFRYTYTSECGLSASASVEYLPFTASSSVAGSADLERIAQRLPTVPAYVQYGWGESSHIRLSGIFRPMSIVDHAADENITAVGWGSQISGRLSILPCMSIYYNYIYGAGITEYISDLYGSGLEYSLNSTATNGFDLSTMMGYNAGVEVALSERVSMNLAYSQAMLDVDKAAFSTSDYKRGTYAFANLFYSATKNLTFATEYLRGVRENMDGEKGDANRVILMAQYRF